MDYTHFGLSIVHSGKQIGLPQRTRGPEETRAVLWSSGPLGEAFSTCQNAQPWRSGAVGVVEGRTRAGGADGGSATIRCPEAPGHVDVRPAEAVRVRDHADHLEAEPLVDLERVPTDVAQLPQAVEHAGEDLRAAQARLPVLVVGAEVEHQHAALAQPTLQLAHQHPPDAAAPESLVDHHRVQLPRVAVVLRLPADPPPQRPGAGQGPEDPLFGGQALSELFTRGLQVRPGAR